MTQQLEKLTDESRATKISYREFLRRDQDDAHVEWIDGKVVPMAPVSDEHQDIAGFLLALLRPFAETSGLGVIRHDPFQMKTAPDLPGRAPDLIFIAKRNISRLRKNHLEGPADLAIEIISVGSRGVDRGEKFFEYEQGGVREYWLIDPLRKEADFYQLSRDGHFRLIPADENGIYRSSVLKGLWIELDWLWKCPPVLSVLKRWKII